MSKFKEVAELYGLELGEKFNIINSDCDVLMFSPYTFTKEGLIDRSDQICSSVLTSLLNGEFDVKKLPWMPTNGETYFYVSHVGILGERIYTKDMFDSMCIKLGNCFKTVLDAGNSRERIVDMFEDVL